MREFSKREKYFVIFCAAFIVFFLGYKFIYLSLIRSYRYNTIKIATLEAKYLSHRELAAQDAFIKKRLKNVRNRLKRVESRFFSGEKDSIVAAQIQQRIEQVCLENGIKVSQSKVLKSEEIGNYKTISVQAVFEGSITATNKILFALKNNQKYFSIPELELRVLSRIRPKTVRTTMTVSGIMRT